MRYSEKIEKIKAYLEKVGAVQTRVVLSVLYYLVGAPVTIGMKLSGHDPLASEDEDGTYWHDRPREQKTLEEFSRQY